MSDASRLDLVMPPAVLSTAGHAFDLAWREIAGNYCSPAARTRARERLARIILANPLSEDSSAEVIKQAGIASMTAAESNFARD
jgi:hypothetical protein